MNQFKKAKQRAEETGHTTEKITDLKTAGVSSNNASSKNLTENNLADDMQQNKSQKITSLSEDSAQMGNKSDEIIQSAISNNTDNPPESPNIDLREETANNTNNTANNIVLDNINGNTLDNIPDNITNSISDNISNNTSDTIPQTPIRTEKLSSDANSAINNIYNTPNPINNNTAYLSNPPAANIIEDQNGALPTALPLQQESVPMPMPPAAVIHEEAAEVTTTRLIKEPEYAYASKPSSKSSGKKNIPNIFAPKGEAKSMRKSLVLKPTSVKIAENYCAKNGGSFNELIQTLLDNFIEEYGL